MGTHLNAVVTSSEDEQSPDIQKKSAEESETKEKAEEVKPKAEEVKPNAKKVKPNAKKVKPKKKQGNVGEVTLRVSLPYNTPNGQNSWKTEKKNVGKGERSVNRGTMVFPRQQS